MDKECMKMYKMQERAQSDLKSNESEKQSLLSKIEKLENENEQKTKAMATQIALMEKKYKKKLYVLQNEINVQKAKNESIKCHFDEKEEKLVKHKREQSDNLTARLIEQQLEYLWTVDCLKYHEGIHDEISHQIAIKIQNKEKEKRERVINKFAFEKECVDI